MSKVTRLLREAAEAAKAARAIAESADAESRDMSESERGDFKRLFETAVERKKDADAAKADEEILAQARAIADAVGDLDPDTRESVKADVDATGRDPRPLHSGGKSLGRLITDSAQYKNLIVQFSGGRDEHGLPRIPEKARVESGPIDIKALWTGEDRESAGVFVVPDQSGIIEPLGRRRLVLRDLISQRRTGSDTIEYIVQTAHENAAAPVPEAESSAPDAGEVAGGYKPEGSWAYERRSTTVRTIAEWVPATKRALADVGQLEGLINDELRADLADVEEDQLLNGDGTGENFTGILNTSGIQEHPKGSDTLFVAVRKAITKARIVGRSAPTAIVMNPLQVEAVDTAVDGNDRFYGLGPFGIGPRTLWGYPMVESETMPEGTALLGDYSKAVLWDREQATVTLSDSHADFFIRNMVAILAEERLAFAVTRPAAFVAVTGLGQEAA